MSFNSSCILTLPLDYTLTRDQINITCKRNHLIWNAHNKAFLILQPLKNNKYRIFKSRYDSIDSYLASCGEKYNDIDLTIDEEINKQLLGAGTDIWIDISK